MPHEKTFKKRYESILGKRQDAKSEQMNAPVFIRDLVLTTPKAFSTGEARVHNNIYGESARVRLREHIQFLFKLTNEEHRANNCEITKNKHYQLKADKQNHITRLLMNEFSLYTEHPLSMKQFKALLSEILELELEPNAHIMLSSFAVRDDTSGKVVNMVLYLEGGNPSTPHLFAKNTAYGIDIDYGKEAFSQQKRGHQVSFHAEASFSETGEAIPMAGIFECSTTSGAQFTQVIDICSDHTASRARALIARRLREADPAELLPEQVEHCITSNSVTQRETQSVSNCVIQADPNVSVHKATGLPLGEGTLTKASQADLKPEGKYSLLEVTSCDTGYEIKHPIFGSDCTIEILKERPAGTYLPKLQTDLLAHNERFCEQAAEKLAASNPRTSLRSP